MGTSAKEKAGRNNLKTARKPEEIKAVGIKNGEGRLEDIARTELCLCVCVLVYPCRV